MTPVLRVHTSCPPLPGRAGVLPVLWSWTGLGGEGEGWGEGERGGKGEEGSGREKGEGEGGDEHDPVQCEMNILQETPQHLQHPSPTYRLTVARPTTCIATILEDKYSNIFYGHRPQLLSKRPYGVCPCVLICNVSNSATRLFHKWVWLWVCETVYGSLIIIIPCLHNNGKKKAVTLGSSIPRELR